MWLWLSLSLTHVWSISSSICFTIHYLSPGFSCGFGLCSHSSLELNGQPGVFAVEWKKKRGEYMYDVLHAITVCIIIMKCTKLESRLECLIKCHSHFHSLDLDAPRCGSLVEDGLHGSGDTLSVTKNFMKAFGTQDVPQRGLGQQPRWVMGVLHIGHWDCGIAHSVVDDSVYRHGDGVPGQDFLRRHSQGNGTQVHFLIWLDTRENKEDTWQEDTEKIRLKSEPFGSKYKRRQQAGIGASISSRCSATSFDVKNLSNYQALEIHHEEVDRGGK